MFVNNTEVDVITRKAIEFISKIENCSHAKSLQAPERIKPRPWRSTASAPWPLTTNNSAARTRQVQAGARRLPRSIQAGAYAVWSAVCGRSARARPRPGDPLSSPPEVDARTWDAGEGEPFSGNGKNQPARVLTLEPPTASRSP